MKESIGCCGPSVIISSPTGILYYNGTDGCPSIYRDIEGYILPVEIKPNKFIDPEFWREQYNTTRSGAVRVLDFMGAKAYNNPEEKVNLTYKQLNEILRKGSANERGSDIRRWHLWREFCLFLEEELIYINGQVNQDLVSVEAWVHINTRYGEGVFTWDNCD